ncbi:MULTISPECIES: hypothetical protein [Klebsiella pneumoniae complex]|uniref:hypothetical protein n=1 Tax=Klebsiella pneumoniae complex TaxID=3390273 RepID=UPI0005424455|nr:MULTISPECIES: hypothetical protein [Klebsiella]KHE28847.1 hypothetical protein JG24_00850 [Klebsiella variicola]MBQ5059594.1 hypothetical protein [Klebsiella variicola]MCJ6485594.1 hypothetical protein [Klebsiella variicola]MDR4849059.1 hypothetical protein [Klebsiella pneumoniae]HBX5814834.1 hypothetical protein [Klebsiella pneumoniae]
MEAKTATFIKTSVDDNGMWLLTVPAGSTGNVTVVVVVRRVEECRYGSEDSPGAHVSITCSLTLYGEGQGTPQTIVAKFVPGTVELFSVEFMLKEFLPRGRGVGSWIMQQMVLWTRSLPPETLVGKIDISSVDAKDIHNLIRRSRLWRGLGFRFPAGQNCSMPLRADELQLPRSRSSTLRVEPLASGVHRLEDGYRGLQEKIVQLEGEILSKKQLIGSIKKHPFLHLLHRKWRQLPDGKCDALPLRAEKLSLPQSGDSDLEMAQRATGVIRLATLCAQSQKRILELERDLASQSEVLVDLQTNRLSNLGEKVGNEALFWGGVVTILGFIYWMLGA